MSNPLRNECVTAALDELSRHGLAGKPEIRNSGHIAICWTDAGGDKEFMTAATPSDRRAHLNARSDIRRMVQVAREPEVEDLPILVVRAGEVLTNTRDVANKFDKRHDHVLRDVDNLLKNIDSPNLGNLFRLEMAPDSNGILRRSYDLTRDGFALLAMGFTGARAIKWKVAYIEAFNTMEKATQSLPASPEVDRLRGDLDALTDIVLSLPAPQQIRVKKPPFVRPSVLRRMRAARHIAVGN
jgi:Rha family phage regulatory protein